MTLRFDGLIERVHGDNELTIEHDIVMPSTLTNAEGEGWSIWVDYTITSIFVTGSKSSVIPQSIFATLSSRFSLNVSIADSLN